MEEVLQTPSNSLEWNKEFSVSSSHLFLLHYEQNLSKIIVLLKYRMGQERQGGVNREKLKHFS